MVIETFLCCFNIREGSWICGAASLLLGILRLLLQWFNLEFRHRMTEEARKRLQVQFSTLQLITVLQMSVAAISMAASICMLIGLFKRWRWLLFPWMVWVVVEELFSFSVIIFFVVAKVKLKCSVYISDAVMLVISVYFMLCVYSYFQQLKRQELFEKITGRQLSQDTNKFEEDERSPLLTNRPV